ncbi:MAG: RsmB/NOP family class I SAM-dependent RNA methyltransferase [Eubacteriales bacterium]|nr:RsmB/NOP family class I SAM-dependent RNA methyltransferase [Eubacteriales bacterium]
MKELPQEYCEKMQELLGEEYVAYRESLEQDSYAAIRVNTNKISVDDWKSICPFSGTQVPWTDKGQYYDPVAVQPAKHPYYYAGLYYIQEPSAMIPALLLPVEPGNRILDLCAAPGGKATEIASKLQGEGLLVANDISVSRAMALAKNLQMAGALGTLVTAEEPSRLAEYFPEYFDGILIDAPCSGEGMFRRDPHMVKDWIEHGPEYYAKIQREILRSAYQMLRPGGYMVYSTCTFSPLEDEEMIGWFISEFSDMQICPVKRCSMFSDGRPEWAGAYEKDFLRYAVRIFPHKAQGEGHFAILLQKNGDHKETESPKSGTSILDDRMQSGMPSRNQKNRKSKETKGKKNKTQNMVDPLTEAGRWLARLHLSTDGNVGSWVQNKQNCDPVNTDGDKPWSANGSLQIKKDQVYLVPKGLPDLQGLRMIQNGLIVGTVKKGRWEPSPQLALAVRDLTDVPKVSLAPEDIRIMKYLKGETIEIEDTFQAKTLTETDGYLLVCVDDFPLGWAKWTANGRLKNKYYAGWRMQ